MRNFEYCFYTFLIKYLKSRTLKTYNPWISSITPCILLSLYYKDYIEYIARANKTIKLYCISTIKLYCLSRRFFMADLVPWRIFYLGPGEARCWVFLGNWVNYWDHLPLDIFGGWHLWTSPKWTLASSKSLNWLWVGDIWTIEYDWLKHRIKGSLHWIITVIDVKLKFIFSRWECFI